MKLINETLYSIEIENVLKERNTFYIDLSDPIQANALAKLFAKYDEMDTVADFEKEDAKDMLKELEKLANWQLEANALFDIAFGVGTHEKMFAGRNSLFTQMQAIRFIQESTEKAGIKMDEYVKKIRKDMLVNDHKSSDTI